MDHNRLWNCLSWNVRGINSQAKCDATRSKITESRCYVICLQETKRQHFDDSNLSKFSPTHLRSFAFNPSNGASASGMVACLMDWWFLLIPTESLLLQRMIDDAI
jgi:exonuclease III